jgi:lipopolysaccharide export system protein LptA
MTSGFASAQGVNRCSLNIRRAGERVERPDSTREGAIIAFIGGPVTVSCGDAVMTGDSAVWRQATQQAVMIGNVRYRDTTRTLNSGRLTYNGSRDEVIAVDDVRLVRISSGAMLEGPRVTFTRAPIAGSRTVATERPRMTLPSGRDGAGEGQITVVDADVAEFVGESEAFASGNIEMVRGDIRATAERAQFSETAARAVLYEDAVIAGEGFDLAGDSIVAGFELGELKTIHSFERAVASGNRFKLQADEIRARLLSIEFAFVEGRADSVSAIGAAAAEHRADSISIGDADLTEPELGVAPGASWIAGDTVKAWFEPDDDLRPPEPALDPELETADARIRRLRAVGDARSFYAAVRDSARSLDPSRNYLLGSEIEISFDGGEPSVLSGVDAIGVFLEPAKEGEGG